MKISPGQLLAEDGREARWRARERLTEGRSFDLWLVDDLHLEGHQGVLKRIRYASDDPGHAAARRALLEAEREVYLLPQTILPEPLDWLVIEGEPLLVYEHQAGETLESILAGRFRGGLGEVRAGRVVRELAHFCDEAHRAGFVLRDLSPAHVLLGLDDVLQLVGLGNVGRAGAVRPEDRHKVSRTEGYSAPETATDRPLHPSADSFCLGALLGYLATGDLRGPLSGPFDDLRRACLSEDPRARPSAVRIYEALRRATAARPRPAAVPARRPTAAPTVAPTPAPTAAKKAAPEPTRKEERAPEKKPRRARAVLIWVLVALAFAAGVAAAVVLLRGP